MRESEGGVYKRNGRRKKEDTVVVSSVQDKSEGVWEREEGV